MAIANNLYFSFVDYILFGSTLLLSMIIGVYYQCKKQNSSEELLMGGRKMPLIPTAMSLMASFVSGISFLAYPAELYTMGAGMCYLILGAIFADIISAVFVIPKLYNLRGISMYRFLEERFQSKGLRLYGSFLFVASTLVWNAVALYAPSVALAKVTGFQTWIMLLSMGVICTLYTSMGGLKAVVWTDTFQAVVMYGGLITAVVKGTITVGSAPYVFATAREHGRLDGFTNINPDPTQYINLWIGIFGGTCTWLGAYGSSQLAQQRYRSLPSARKAQVVVMMNIPIMILIYFLIYYNALIMFAYYSDCDPLKAGLVKGKDQLVVYFTMDLLGSIYGLPGLFLASMCSATLSTISSGINAMASVALDDFVRSAWPKLGEKKEAIFTKAISFLFGILIVCLAFAAEPLGGVFVTSQRLAGILGGPLVGLVMLGVFIPRVEKIGASAGVVMATCFVVWIFVGATINNVSFPTLDTSIDGCSDQNISVVTNNLTRVSNESSNHLSLYNVSFVLYPLLGSVPVFVIGAIISSLVLCFKGRTVKIWSYPMNDVSNIAEISKK